ncbi:hypothetical protein D3C72_1591050 [compost metagenome]
MRAASSHQGLGQTVWMSSVISEICRLTARFLTSRWAYMTRSRSVRVTTPTRASSIITGKRPTSCSIMSRSTSDNGVSGGTVTTWWLMMPFTGTAAISW